MDSDEYGHKPVLLAEVLDGMQIRPDGQYIDCTFGRGGHSRAILERLGREGILCVLDRDPEAIRAARELAAVDRRVRCYHTPFSSLADIAGSEGMTGRVDGILFDLGVSSPQLDDSSRGFSFSHDGALDMRMDPGTGQSAAQWINTAGGDEIGRVLREYGEEKFYRRIAVAILAAREQALIETTSQLAAIIADAVPTRELKKHPATRAFQAIRIHINNELGEITDGLAQAFDVLKIHGRLLVISFHSLEDRIVKRFMRGLSQGDPYPKEVPVTHDMVVHRMRTVGKAIMPSDREIAENPRARSAVLRIAEKLA